MDSDFIKDRMFHYLMFERNSVAVATEYGNAGGIADLIAVNKNLYVTEYEIKVSKADLMGELNSIEFFFKHGQDMFGGEEWQKGIKKCNKYSKHKLYLDGVESAKPKWYNSDHIIHVPNQFYFVVPEDLVQYCGILDKTPYGLMQVKYNSPEVLKRPKKLHTNKIDQQEIMDIAHRLSYEVLAWRQKRITK